MENTLFVFNNLNIAVCVDGEQIPELQEPWILQWARKAEALGYDPTTFLIKGQDGLEWRLFKLPGGSYNWALEPFPINKQVSRDFRKAVQDQLKGG